MSILQNLPLSLCESGPEQIDGIGNYYLQVLAPAPSQLPLSILYFLDSHGQVPSKIFNPDYEPIKQSQIDWFVSASQAQRNAREKESVEELINVSAVLGSPIMSRGLSTPANQVAKLVAHRKSTRLQA